EFWIIRLHTRYGRDLTEERTREKQRAEKLLEAMVMITSVVSDGMTAKSAVAMVAALIDGERDPRAIADLAKGRLRGKRDAVAEIGLNMALSPTPPHLGSWMGLCRSAAQSGTRHGKGKPKKGNSYARAAAGQAAIGAAGTATFLGERYARIARRRGGAIAQVA